MSNPKEKEPKVVGIGGIFFKSESPENMRNWYSEKLGLVTNEYGSLFEFRDSDNPEQKGYLQWSPFEKNTEYFAPSEKQYMINYRVQNIEKLIENLRVDGVQIVGEIETFDYGKFAHIIDPEGNKIEFWEPIDEVFTELYEDKTTK
ncbi:MAG: glyoxalase [Ignavibacteriae bacterium HGW-Ignavibacteriae-4]|jgi:predicted enzyme related to lactoylglutathione lyase|nr:MAG: glyoxalase [Ignavibacteriae bacterium HGW-Ignavibacteriae-4]